MPLPLAPCVQELVEQYVELASGPLPPRSPLAFAWLLFLAAKAALLPVQPDIVSCHALLLACAAFVLQSLPPALLRVSPSDIGAFPARNASGTPDVLASLVATQRMGKMAPRLQRVASALDAFVTERLTVAGLQAGEPATPTAGGLPPTGLRPQQPRPAFPALFGTDGAAAPEAVAVLNNYYASRVAAVQDIDERPFIVQAAAAAGCTRAALSDGEEGTSPLATGTPVRLACMRLAGSCTPDARGAARYPARLVTAPAPSAPFCTPPARRNRFAAVTAAAERASDPGAGLLTPVGAALAAAEWLHSLAAEVRGPSPTLAAAMEACGQPGLVAQLEAGALASIRAVLPPPPSPEAGPQRVPPAFGAEAEADQEARRSQALALYWRLLDRLVAAEAGGVQQVAGGAAGPAEQQQQQQQAAATPAALVSAAAALLTSPPPFHACLAAVAVECVAAAYRLPSLVFPTVLEALRVQAFDVGRLLGAVVRAEPGLPRGLRCHLLWAEERVLEQLAWARGSSLYPRLAAACGTARPGAHSPPPLPLKRGWDGAPRAAGLTPASTRADTGGAAGAAPQPSRCPGASPLPVPTPAAASRPPPMPTLPLCFGSDCSPAAAGCEGAATVAAQQQRQALPPRGDRAARAAVGDFLRRLLHLAGVRLADLLGRLGGGAMGGGSGDGERADAAELLAQVGRPRRSRGWGRGWGVVLVFLCGGGCV